MSSLGLLVVPAPHLAPSIMGHIFLLFSMPSNFLLHTKYYEFDLFICWIFFISFTIFKPCSGTLLLVSNLIFLRIAFKLCWVGPEWHLGLIFPCFCPVSYHIVPPAPFLGYFVQLRETTRLSASHLLPVLLLGSLFSR